MCREQRAGVSAAVKTNYTNHQTLTNDTSCIRNPHKAFSRWGYNRCTGSFSLRQRVEAVESASPSPRGRFTSRSLTPPLQLREDPCHVTSTCLRSKNNLHEVDSRDASTDTCGEEEAQFLKRTFLCLSAEDGQEPVCFRVVCLSESRGDHRSRGGFSKSGVKGSVAPKDEWIMLKAQGHSDLNTCECDISGTPIGNFITSTTNIHSDSRTTWLEVGGQRFPCHLSSGERITEWKSTVCWSRTTAVLWF